MPKFNLDEDKSLFSPIEFVIDGKQFVVSSLKQNTIEKIGDSTKVSEQFALLVGIEEKVAADLNMIKMAKAIRIVMESLIKPFEVEVGLVNSVVEEKAEEKKEGEVKNGLRPGQKK